ncbi:MAG: DUF6801 domain-containing protein [Haloechinothrix sp.]
MSTKKRSKKLAAVIAASGSAGLIAATLAVSAGISSADPVSLTVNYTCPFPMIGDQAVSVEINSDMPASIPVGEATPPFDIHAISNAGQATTEGLNLVGAKTIEGDALADSTVTAPEATLDVQVPTDIPVQDVPPNGNDLIVEAFGETPSLTFSEPGTATITVGDLLLTLTPRKADGSETGLGTFESQCTQDEGQDNVLHTFEITEGGTDTGGTDTGGTDTGGGGGGGDPIKLVYDLNGSSYIKAPDGTVPLSGDIDVNFDLASGQYTSDLMLDKTRGEFMIFGFFPASSDIEFEQVGQTTGTFDGSNLTSHSEMYIKLTSVSVYGFPIGGGPDCRTVRWPLPLTAGAIECYSEPTQDGVLGRRSVPLIADGDRLSIISHRCSILSLVFARLNM